MAILALGACGPAATADENPTVGPAYVDDLIPTPDGACDAPCWHGLVPGESSYEEVLDMVRLLPFLEPSSLREPQTNFWDWVSRRNQQGASIQVECLQSPGTACVTLYATPLYLSFIDVFLEPGITLGDIITRVGIPDIVATNPAGADRPGCFVEVVWGEWSIIGLLQDLGGPAPDGLCATIPAGQPMDPATRISVIEYVPEGSLLREMPGWSTYPWPRLPQR